MRLKKSLMISAVVTASILALGACASGEQRTSSVTVAVAQSPSSKPAPRWPSLHDAGTMTIGTKFDQPLFGLKGPDGKPVGFDVEIGKIIAGTLGIPADKIKWVETVSANREPFIENGTVDIVVATYTINDKRKEVVSFAGPYYNAGQDILVLQGQPGDDQGTGGPQGQERLQRRRFHARRRTSQKYGVNPDHDRHLLQLPRAAAQRQGDRRHHRQRHPGRPRRPERGRVQAGRQTRSPRSPTASA